MVDNSMLSESMMRSITFLYDGTRVLHPESRSFVDQVQSSLQETNKTRFDSIGEPENSFERQRANDAVREKMQVIQRYFGPVQREQT
jgi:hypothetical protein